jgi:transposase-like protein
VKSRDRGDIQLSFLSPKNLRVTCTAGRAAKRRSGHRLQVDIKFLERIAGTRRRFYQFTAIDDCTRIRVLKIYDACNQRTAIEFIEEVLRRLPFRVQVIQTDNGAEFQSHFRRHLEAHDIRHVYIRPRTPLLNGWNDPIASTTRSSASSSIAMELPTMFTSSTSAQFHVSIRPLFASLSHAAGALFDTSIPRVIRFTDRVSQ